MPSRQSEIEVDLLCAYGKQREIVAWDVSTLRESACERTWLATNAIAALAALPSGLVLDASRERDNNSPV